MAKARPSGSDAWADERDAEAAMPSIDEWDGRPDVPVKAAAAWQPPRRPLRMLQTTYLCIMRHLTTVEPEAGGMLLGPKECSVVTHYVPDRGGIATPMSFTVDAAGLNRVLKKALQCGLDAKGLVHSHPASCTHPSGGDLDYVRKAFLNAKNSALKEFLLPIVCDGVLYPYVITPDDAVVIHLADLVLF